METEVEVEGKDEGMFEESGAGKSSSILSSPNHVTDPVVYKLVRVEGDGRLVPATDDELKEVEVLLTGDNSEMHIVEDTGQAVGCISNEGSSSGIPHLESSEGLSSPENERIAPNKLNARFEYIEEMLQKVKEEERLHLACGSPDYRPAYVILDSQSSDEHDKLPGIEENFQSELFLQGTVPSLKKSLNGSCMNQSGSAGECSNPSDEPVGGSSSVCTTVETSKPDFSKLNGEIYLDNLSIRELHETFKATFGRDSSVKDKQWLKRRIAMGLTNSCDVSTTPYIIKDSKLIKKEDSEESYVDGSLANDPAVGGKNGSKEVSPVCHGSQLGDHQTVSGKRSRNQITDDNYGSDNNHTEQRARRVRKPTRRYIEEVSEAENKDSSGRMNPAKSAGLVPMSPKYHVRPVKTVSSDGKIVITRFDSLGGSGIEVPCVSRVRRSQPRKNFMDLLKFGPSGIGTAATLVKKSLGALSFQPVIGNENEVRKASSSPEQVQHGLIGEPVQYKQVSVMGADGMGHDLELKDAGTSDSDDKVAIVPTTKGGIRRKHHRAWTLSEVMKLVEGVARFGPGKWSEIKRISSASYSYRTSVDLKDKWRNLLKASIAQTPPHKGMNSRKTAGTVPIPEPILLRVRELAEIQAQSPPNHISSKVAVATVTTTIAAAAAPTSSSSSSVQNKQAGFL